MNAPFLPNRLPVLGLCVLLLTLTVHAQDIPLTPDRWHLEPNERTEATIESVTDAKGQAHEAIRFQVDYERLSPEVGYDPGIVYVTDIDFHNGTIEADLVGPISDHRRTFVGIVFRIDEDDPEQSELVYFRPFNSGTNRHENTVQYVARGTKYDWPYLRENHPGVYEAGADIANNEWFHVRLEVEGTTARVFVNDAETPSLVVSDLKHGDRSGGVGFWGYPGAFANLKVTTNE